MDRHDFIRELGWTKNTDPQSSDLLTRIEKIVQKAVAAEREACAKVCERLPAQQDIDVRDQCAAAIRARGGE